VSDLQHLTADQKELALQVNSLLMAVHLWDDKAIDDVLSSAGDECGHVMLGAILFLKETLDGVFETISQCEALDMQFSFEDLVRVSAQTIINAEESC
jgi:hypothetical protein